jgi:DNA-binding XRE family transcriptional regulator
MTEAGAGRWETLPGESGPRFVLKVPAASDRAEQTIEGMKLTLEHPSVTNGTPVFIDTAGSVIPSELAIQSLRHLCGMTANEFGKLIGVSGRTVNGWEQGRRVNEAAIWRIKNTLGSSGVLTPPVRSQ